VAVCSSELQCVAVCCSVPNVLQCVALRCCVLLCHFRTLASSVNTHCNTLQHTATHCNTMQHTATQWIASRIIFAFGKRYFICDKNESSHCFVKQCIYSPPGIPPPPPPPPPFLKFRDVFEDVETHCNTLQHTVTHCNILQHTATHCNTL